MVVVQYFDFGRIFTIFIRHLFVLKPYSTRTSSSNEHMKFCVHLAHSIFAFKRFHFNELIHNLTDVYCEENFRILRCGDSALEILMV